MHVDQPGGEIGTGDVNYGGGVVALAGPVHTGHQFPHYPYISLSQLPSPHVDDGRPDEQEVKWALAQCGPHRSGPIGRVYGVSHTS